MAEDDKSKNQAGDPKKGPMIVHSKRARGKQTEENKPMPDFITKAPWYVSQGTDNLEHQKFKSSEPTDSIDTWYDKGKFEQTVITKFRKGACKNCGAMTHTEKFCCERPRKLGAKYTGKNFGKDEIIQNIALGFEAKRDRWNGYDPAEYSSKIEDWNQQEEIRKQRKAEELAKKLAEKGSEKPGEGQNLENVIKEHDDLVDDTREKDEEGQTFANKDPKIKTTIRNLRMREDQAGYMKGFREEKVGSSTNPHDTAFIDPKQIYLKSDSFVKSEEYEKYAEQAKFAQEAKEKVKSEINPIANPSQTEIIFKDYKKKKEQIKSKMREELLAKYGGAEHLEAQEDFIPEEIEEYHEYGPDGKPIKKGLKKVKATKYPEDVYVNGHTSVWGSYYDDDLGWGYQCCLSHDKNSQCKGEEGKRDQLKANLERKMKKNTESPKKSE